MAQDPRTASSVIHLALLGGQLAFAAVSIVIERSVAPPEGLSADLLLLVAVGICGSAIGASEISGRILMRSARSLHDEAERMAAGLRTFIVRMAILEAAGFTAIASYLLSGENTFLGIFAVVLVVFILRKPSDTDWESIQTGDITSSRS